MLETALERASRILLVSWEGLNGTAVWLTISFAAAGVLRNFLSPEFLQRSLGNARPCSIFKAVGSGLLLPICSCGIIPLGVSLYYSGAYIGPTLAFMTATPVTNPAAILLSVGFLGPKLAMLYVASGVLLSLVVGFTGNALAGPELCLSGAGTARDHLTQTSKASVSRRTRFFSGLRWGFGELGPMVAKYVCLGMLLMGLIAVLVPPSFIRDTLGNPSMLSLTGVALLGAVMYICAVGHIPFIAMLVASGAAPGVAVTFLLAGVATNLPELLTLYRLIGRRTAVLYFVLVSLGALVSGAVVNAILMPGFVPFMNMEASMRSLRLSNYLSLDPSNLARAICALFVLGMALRPIWLRLFRLPRRISSILFSCLFFCVASLASLFIGTRAASASLNSAHPLFAVFESQMPRVEVILTAECDLNGDGDEDLIVLYSIGRDVNRMLVVLAKTEDSDGPVLTNEHPAPVANQVIQFKDIDETPPMEFIVYGTKGVSAGFAVYRCHGGVLEDLFGENMRDCCN
jgi:uncharacterized membrane protein YraQ (UPF0718 family)